MIDIRSCAVSFEMRPARATMALGALLTAIAIAVTACGGAGPTPTSQFTEVPIAATPWPSGTIGQYGLHIDPSLLRRLPQTISAQPLVEDAYSESAAMDNADLAKTFDGFAAAGIGQIGDTDWLVVAIGHFKPDLMSPDVYPDQYSAWIEQYATGACSQANAVADTSQQQIGGWLVDVATCAGGPVVYSLSMGNGLILSMFGAGPKKLGHKLIEALY
jgi:hypothetical protein